MATSKDIQAAIHAAGQNRHTIMITAREHDGSIETREAEPYSYRVTAGSRKFFCYDIKRRGTRNFLVSNILSIEETGHPFTPQWPIEV